MLWKSFKMKKGDDPERPSITLTHCKEKGTGRRSILLVLSRRALGQRWLTPTVVSEMCKNGEGPPKSNKVPFNNQFFPFNNRWQSLGNLITYSVKVLRGPTHQDEFPFQCQAPLPLGSFQSWQCTLQTLLRGLMVWATHSEPGQPSGSR